MLCVHVCVCVCVCVHVCMCVYVCVCGGGGGRSCPHFYAHVVHFVDRRARVCTRLALTWFITVSCRSKLVTVTKSFTGKIKTAAGPVASPRAAAAIAVAEAALARVPAAAEPEASAKVAAAVSRRASRIVPCMDQFNSIRRALVPVAGAVRSFHSPPLAGAEPADGFNCDDSNGTSSGARALQGAARVEGLESALSTIRGHPQAAGIALAWKSLVVPPPASHA